MSVSVVQSNITDKDVWVERYAPFREYYEASEINETCESSEGSDAEYTREMKWVCIQVQYFYSSVLREGVKNLFTESICKGERGGGVNFGQIP